jgi:hypothetical protein
MARAGVIVAGAGGFDKPPDLLPAGGAAGPIVPGKQRGVAGHAAQEQMPRRGENL